MTMASPARRRDHQANKWRRIRILVVTSALVQGLYLLLPCCAGQQFGQQFSSFRQFNAIPNAPQQPIGVAQTATPAPSLNIIRSLNDASFLNTFRTLFNQRGATARAEIPADPPVPVQTQQLPSFGIQVQTTPSPAVVQSNLLSVTPSSGLGSFLSFDARGPLLNNLGNNLDRVDGVSPTPRPVINSIIQSVQDARFNLLAQQQQQVVQAPDGVIGNLGSNRFFFPQSSNNIQPQPTGAPVFAPPAQFPSQPAFGQPTVGRFFMPQQAVAPLPTAGLNQVALPPGLSEQLNVVSQNVQQKPDADRAKILEDAGRIQGLLAQLIRAQTDLERSKIAPTPPEAIFVRTSTTTTTPAPPPPRPQTIQPAVSPIIVTGSGQFINRPVQELTTASRPVVLVPPGRQFATPTLKQLQEAIPISLPKGLDPNLNFDVQTFFKVFEKERASNLEKLAITSPERFEAQNEVIPPSERGSARADSARRINSGSSLQQLTPGGVAGIFPTLAPVLIGKSPEEQSRLASDTLNVLSLLNEIRRAQSILSDTERARTTQAPPSTTPRVEVVESQPKPAIISTPLPERTFTETTTPLAIKSTTQKSETSSRTPLPVTTPLPPVEEITPSSTAAAATSELVITSTSEAPSSPEPTTPAGIPIAALLGGNDAISISVPNPNRKGADDLFLPPITYRPPANETLSSFLGRICVNFRCGVRFIKLNDSSTQLSLKLRPIKGANAELPDFLLATTTEAPTMATEVPTVPTPSIIPSPPPTPAQENPLVKSLCSRFKCNFKLASTSTAATPAAMAESAATSPQSQVTEASVSPSETPVEPLAESTTVSPGPSSSTKKPRRSKSKSTTVTTTEPPTTPLPVQSTDVGPSETPGLEPAAEIVPVNGQSEQPNVLIVTEVPTGVSTLSETPGGNELPLAEIPAAEGSETTVVASPTEEVPVAITSEVVSVAITSEAVPVAITTEAAALPAEVTTEAVALPVATNTDTALLPAEATNEPVSVPVEAIVPEAAILPIEATSESTRPEVITEAAPSPVVVTSSDPAAIPIATTINEPTAVPFETFTGPASIPVETITEQAPQLLETATEPAPMLLETDPPLAAGVFEGTAPEFSPLPSPSVPETARILPETLTTPPSAERNRLRPLSFLGSRGGRQGADLPPERPFRLVSELQGFYFNRLYSTLFEALAGSTQQTNTRTP